MPPGRSNPHHSARRRAIVSQNQTYQGEVMPKLFRVLTVAFVALGGISMASAQTKPVVTTLGPDFAKTGIFIGNSFFYYNNGLPGHLSLMEKAADPDHKQDDRNTMVTIGGSGLDWQDAESYFRPKAIGNH